MKRSVRPHPSVAPLVVRPFDPVAARRRTIGLVSLWLLSLAATWAIACKVAAPGWIELRAELAEAERTRDAALEELDRVKQRLSISERSDQVSRSANEALKEQLTSREEEIAALRADLAFYQRLIGGKGPRQGLTVQQLALRRIGDGQGFELRATLTQNLRKGEVTSGTAQIRIEGMLAGRLISMSWEDLEQRRPQHDPEFSFKYFQELDASFVLPEGFIPNRIVLVMKSAQGDQFERSFSWEQALATGADEHVWK